MKQKNILKSLTVKIFGTVQGIGFRPYIYRIAVKNNLAGFVVNTAYGVEISVEGTRQNINNFIIEIEQIKLKTADISRILTKKQKISNYKNFAIRKSKKNSKLISNFPPDIALCSSCKQELLSKQDRRYRYPFINCTQCGPRYSIIKALPYDRQNTTMQKFKMCNICGKEYSDIINRRFHAQPNACGKCGPKVLLYIKNKLKLTGSKAVVKISSMLDNGKIIAIKSIGGYHLACDAYNKKTILKLRKIKSREQKPFAVMVKDIATAKKIAFVNKWEEEELLSHIAPIVLLRKKDNIAPVFNDAVSQNNNYLGIMTPYAPLHYILFDLLKTNILIMTSANKNDEHIIYKEEDIFNEFGNKVDAILANDREIYNPVDDSIISFLDKSPEKIIIRRSRGYVPNPIKTNVVKNILAIGADIKNSFCITRSNQAYLSTYCGDIFNYSNLSFLEQSVNKFSSFLEIIPNKAVCDLHPGYNTSNYINDKFSSSNVKIIRIQHHYAHIASVIAEHNLKNEVLGFAYDGTGFGYDNKIWGSECLLFSKNKTFTRLAHFEYFDLPGGDMAAKEIWRTALSLLNKFNKTNFVPKHIKNEKIFKNILAVLEDKNSIQTCSAGRLLDGITSIIGLSNYSSYEGEAPTYLEYLLEQNKVYESYDFDIEFNKDNQAVIKLEKIINAIVSDIQKKKSLSLISGKTHETIVRIIIKQATMFTKKYKVNQIALSGGIFQNKYILSRTVKILKQLNFNVYFNSQTPINDGGIALGQAYLA